MPSRFVCILESLADPRRHYVGHTTDVRQRLEVHNSGGSVHTRRDRPWIVLVTVEFMNERAAIVFEKYLKSGSGRAFSKRHFF